MPSPSGQCMEGGQHSSSQLLTSDPWYLNGTWAMTDRTSYCFATCYIELRLDNISSIQLLRLVPRTLLDPQATLRCYY